MKKFLPFSNSSVPDSKLRNANPLALSFVGDGVHTLFIRAAVLSVNPFRNDVLHSLAAEYVCAPSQAEDAKIMLPLLTPCERQIFNKAKNAKLNTVPKHATLYQYQLATAFEAVTGYLFLAGDNDRLYELYSYIYADKLSEINDSVTQTTVHEEDKKC